MNAAQIRLAGAGRAYQAVAQSTAIAVQDATDYLRNVGIISTTSIGVAMAQMAATNGDKGGKLLAAAQGLMPVAIQNFQQVSAAAIQVASDYPKSFQ